jgi:hypothetical protein
MSSPDETNNRCIIVVADLFAKINAQRKLLKRTPVEERAMASRCTLRFNINRNRRVDFSAEKIVLTPEEIGELEKMVNDQFGLYFDGEIKRLCVKPPQPKKPKVERSEFELAAEFAMMEPEKTEKVSWFKRLFGGK